MNTDEHIFMDMEEVSISAKSMVFRDNGKFIHIYFSHQELIDMQIRIKEVTGYNEFLDLTNDS